MRPATDGHAAGLALLGGPRAVPPDLARVDWPIVTDDDRASVLRVLDSGRLSSNTYGETEVPALEEKWARWVGVQGCVGVASGTAAISLALEALGVGVGDEVIVPALTFAATALAVTHVGAVPRFVDVNPWSFNLDPRHLEAAAGPRTAAIVPVHLHGLPADMDEVLAVARRRGLAVVEDAAQAHGATYRGRMAGSLADAGCFSLNSAKNIPTCGEGGLVTTSDLSLAARIATLRQFGERPDERTRTHISRVRGWNAKLNPIQAAFARSQLDRFPAYEQVRQRNVRDFLARTGALPGLVAPAVPDDRTHSWHILRFRLAPERAGLDVPRPAFRQTLHRVLRAEGVPVSRYQLLPLPAQDGLRPGGDAAPDREACPNTVAVIADSLTLQKRHLHPGSGPLLARYADAFEKVWQNLETVARLAQELDEAGTARAGTR